jgi:apolipoprotein D and lipocalin family protein
MKDIIQVAGALFLFLGLAITTGWAENPVTGNARKPQTVPRVDLSRYIGIWYEIAKIPNRFQKKCARDTTAEYRQRQDGLIDVINRCVDKNGKLIEAKGIAKIAEPKTNSKLKVSFVRFLGIQLFWGDYWIIGLEKDYQYAVVGDPDRKYGWILSRNNRLTDQEWTEIRNILKTQGYDPDRFVPTEHPEKK